MRTPAGTECTYFYEDHHRGREIATCRIPRGPRSSRWAPDQCGRCPVPAILMANGSPHLELELTARKGFAGLGSRMAVQARCRLHDHAITDPHLGCERCSADLLASIEVGEQGGSDV